VLDPRSGRPAEAIALAAALAPTAAEADALATAFFVLGIEATRRYCDEYPQIGAILLADQPEAELIAVNVPAMDLTPDDSLLLDTEWPGSAD
jgi:thiamine biosynthesis lipoprotein